MQRRKEKVVNLKHIEITKGKEKIIKEYHEKLPNPKLWKWQFKLENAILSFIFVCAFIFVVYLFSKML